MTNGNDDDEEYIDRSHAVNNGNYHWSWWDMTRQEVACVSYICIWLRWPYNDYGDDHHDEAAGDGDDHLDYHHDDGDYHAIYDSVDKMTREGGGCLPLSATVNRRFGLDALCSNIT